MSAGDVERTIEQARATGRRAQRALRAAKALLEEGAAPATVAEIARWVGLSGQKVREDERRGEIRAKVKGRRGSKSLFEPAEAVRYLRQMGVAF